MIAKCCVCKKFLGIRLPILYFSITHGICEDCKNEVLENIKFKLRIVKKIYIENICKKCGHEFLSNYSTPPCEICGCTKIRIKNIS